MTRNRAEYTNTQINPRPVRVAAYVRVSSDEQVDTWSLDSQRSIIQDHCARNPGFALVETYVEEGHSAWSKKSDLRPEYLRMMSDAEAGKFDLVITTTIDRMSRSLSNMLSTIERLSECNVDYKSITEDYDFSGPQGQFFLAMMASMAQLFSSQISAHVKRALRQRVLKGLTIGRPPYGYQICDDNCDGAEGKHGYCHVNEQKAAKVVEIHTKYASGTYSYQDLADMMHDEGYRTNGHLADRHGHDRSGFRFTGGAIRRILHNPFYRGLVKLNEDYFPGAHEPIISEELYERVMRVAEERAEQFESRGRKSSQGHQLAKIVRCHECGSRLHASQQGTQRGNTYYLMPRRAKGPECHFAGRSFKGSSIDDVIDRLFRGFALRDDWKAHVLNSFMEETQVEQLKKRKNSLLRKKGRANELYIDGEISRNERDLQVADINKELETTDVLDDDAVERAAELLEDFSDLWAIADRQERNDMLRTVLEAVYVDCDKREIVSIQPNQAFAALLRAMIERSDLALVEATEPPFSREFAPSGGR